MFFIKLGHDELFFDKLTLGAKKCIYTYIDIDVYIYILCHVLLSKIPHTCLGFSLVVLLVKHSTSKKKN